MDQVQQEAVVELPALVHLFMLTAEAAPAEQHQDPAAAIPVVMAEETVALAEQEPAMAAVAEVLAAILAMAAQVP